MNPKKNCESFSMSSYHYMRSSTEVDADGIIDQIEEDNKYKGRKSALLLAVNSHKKTANRLQTGPEIQKLILT